MAVAAVGAAVVLGGPAPAARQDAPAVSVPVTTFKLPNGLTVILHEDHSVPKVAVNLWYHAGSGREKPGRTGFAHLFEHLMFEGSSHVKEGEFDTLLESVGGSNNGSTSSDRTNYYETVPSNALDMALFLESDRMGYLLDVVTPELVDRQRDVVKNERRQRYENAPYGMAFVRIVERMYPKGHPYSWPGIGYMEDLSAATHQDVLEFFKTYYAPGNASLVIAGDINPAEVRKKVEYWFSDVKPGAAVPPLEVAPAELSGVIKETLPDQVQLPRIYLTWHTPAFYSKGDAELDVTSGILSTGKSSRLYQRLVYDLQLAQDVAAQQVSSLYGSFYMIVATARPSADPPETALARITAIVDEELEKLRNAPPAAREVERVKNGIEANFLSQMETIEAKADLLNQYYMYTGTPDFFSKDLARYRAIQPADIQAAVRQWLPAGKRFELSIVPAKQ
jgi:zinc protease